MRSVVQRVSRASVTVDGEVIAAVGPGLAVLVGVVDGDTPADSEYTASKIRDLRIVADERGRMNRSVRETGGAVLVVSQFTLCGDARKGRRPSFAAAAAPGAAALLVERVVQRLRDGGLTVETGRFGAHMELALVNDGPVTILIDSRREF